MPSMETLSMVAPSAEGRGCEESAYVQSRGVSMFTHGTMSKHIALLAALLVVLLAANAEAQSSSNDTWLFFNAAGHYSMISHDYHNIGAPPPGNKTVLNAEERAAVVSLSPTWRIGEKTALELELGFWATSIRSEMNGEEQYASADAWFIMPHYLLVFGTVDSVFTPYAKVGVGLTTGDGDGIPLGWSAGAGGFLTFHRSWSVKAEVCY